MRIIVAVGHESSTMLEDALIGFSVGGDVNAIDHPRLLSTLDRIIDRYASAEMDEIDIGAFLTDITNAMRECKLELPSCLTAVARGLLRSRARSSTSWAASTWSMSSTDTSAARKPRWTSSSR